MLRKQKKQFNETQFYSNLFSAAHRLPIKLNFVLQFSNNVPLFEMPIKILFPTSDALKGNNRPLTTLSNVLRRLRTEGFTDITIIDLSCFDFDGIGFNTEKWHRARESYENVKQFTPGNKLGGARLRNRPHCTRKRLGSRRRRSTRPRRTRRRQRGT